LLTVFFCLFFFSTSIRSTRLSNMFRINSVIKLF
jgi:hypothetical protein